MALEDVELEAAPLEATMDDLDDICPTDREIAEAETGACTPAVEQKPLTWTWSGVGKALVRAWDVADTHLANLFGLNESKYEWAVREYHYQKRMEAEETRQAVEQPGSQEMQNLPCDDFQQMPQTLSSNVEGSMLV